MTPALDVPTSDQRQIQRLNWALAAYARSTAALIRHTSFDDLAAKICQALVESGAYILAFIGLAEPGPDKPVRVVARAGPASSYIDGISLSWSEEVPGGRGPTGHAIRTGEPHIIRDSLIDAKFALWRDRGSHFGIRSSLTVPFKQGSQPIGALVVYAAAPDAFGDEELALFQQLADEAAFAMALAEERTRMRAAEAARERSEKLVRQERDFSEAVIDSLPGILYLYDESGRFLRWNKMFKTVSGYTDLEIARMHPAEFFGGLDRDRVAAQISKTFQDGSSAMEAAFLTKDGRSIPYYFTGVATRIEGRRCLVGVGIDMTEQVKAEEAERAALADLARVARLSTLGEFTASISHELNQPLAAIVTNSDASLRWLARDPPNIDEARQAIGRTIRDARRASDVITRVRAVLVKQPTRYDDLDLNEIVTELLILTHDQQKEACVTVETALPSHPLPVRGDRIQLQQVVLNLILNGIDAMKPIADRPRVLSIRTRMTEAGEAVAEVRDTGIGLDPATIDQLFDRFFTTKQGGTGLGLSISRSLAEAHGGRLVALPGEPFGAIFQLILPVSRGAAA